MLDWIRDFFRHEGLVVRGFYRVRQQIATDAVPLVRGVPMITNEPPEGHFRVTNLYVDAIAGTLVVEYENEP